MAAGESVTHDQGFELSHQQVAYFETFGFLKLPGLFQGDIERITAAFEDVFGDPNVERLATFERVHFKKPRETVQHILNAHSELTRLRVDPRVLGVVRGLVGGNYVYTGSEGSLLYCETSWHCDTYASRLEQYNIKLSLYLDPLRRNSGAIRVVPGTNHFQDIYAATLRRDLRRLLFGESIYGVTGSEIPCWIVESDPGDLVVHDYRTMHASYNGGEPRRHLAVNFRRCDDDAERSEPS